MARCAEAVCDSVCLVAARIDVSCELALQRRGELNKRLLSLRSRGRALKRGLLSSESGKMKDESRQPWCSCA